MGMLMLHEERSGLYAALNKGFRRLNSAWLTWINADDILYPSGVSAYGDVLDAADIHYGTVDFIDADGRFLHAWRSASPQRLGSLYRAGCSPLLQQGTIFRRKVFERLDGFDSSMSYVGDADFWWRALEAGFGFRRLRYPTVAGFRLHDAQLSHVHAVEMRREHQDMVVARTGHASRWALSPTATAYRLSNASRYVVRLLRCRDVTGEFRLPRSYDAP
jgi:GT2 family glycosyltransferase